MHILIIRLFQKGADLMPGFAILFTFFLIFMVNAVSGAVRRKKPPRRILMSVKDREAGIEATVRLLLFKNPRSEIYITDQGSCDETPEILRRLEKDCSRIHVSCKTT